MANDLNLPIDLAATVDEFPMEGLHRLGEHLPMAWIEEALASTGTASIRKRRLPAEQVVWLVIALALFRRISMSEVLETLELALPTGNDSAVSRGAITMARHRLGASPLETLFARTAKVWCGQEQLRHAWKGLSPPRANNAETEILHSSQLWWAWKEWECRRS